MLLKDIWISLALSVLLLTGSGTLHAQLQVWRHIDVSGMANKNVNCFTEGPSGFLYFGTHEGLELFDGRRFHKIEVPNHISKGVNPFVNAMKWDKNGLLWVVTRSHIFNYNPASGAVHISHNTPKATILFLETDTVLHRLYTVDDYGFNAFSIKDTALRLLYSFPLTGIMHMVQSPGALFVIKDGREVIEIRDTVRRVVYRDKNVKDIAYMPLSKALIALSSEGLQFFDLKSGNKKALKAQKAWDLKSPKTRITPLADDALLIQNAENVALLRRLEDTCFVNFSPDIRNPGSIQSNFLNFACSDRRKNMWVAEDGVGVSVLPANSGNIQYLPGAMVGAARLWKLYHDRAGKQIFASSENGLCAIHYVSDTADYRPNIKPKDTKLFEVMGYVRWSRDTLLLITNGQGSWLFNTTNYAFKSYAPLNTILHRKGFWGGMELDGNRLLLWGANGSYIFNRQNLSLQDVEGIRGTSAQVTDVESRKYEIYCAWLNKNEIWLGTGYGIIILNGNGDFLRKIGDSRSEKNNGLGNTVVLDIKQGLDGKIYVATMGGGIYEYAENGWFHYLPLTCNLTSIYCIEPIDAQHLLLTTTNGLCLYNTVNGQSHLITENNGMPITDFNQFALVCDSQFVLGAGSKGVVMIGKAGLYNNFRDTAELRVMSGPRAISSLTLAKGVNTIELDITIAGYAANAPWTIEYKLDGVDDNWRTMTRGEWHIRYNSISPGEYNLQVRATDEQHVVWTKPVNFAVKALPFFWQTKWFKIALFCICLVVVIFVVRFFSQQGLKWKLKKLENEKKIFKERLRISRELHDNVGSQLTYLITGLETSRILLRQDATGVLEQKIDRMQLTARESMQQLRDAIWALNSENVAASVFVNRFKEWLHKIMEEFPGIKFSLTERIDTDVLIDPVKSLNLFRIMQEAVHNVVKHANATELSILFVCEDGQLSISIKDNGKGYVTNVRTGNGLRGMTERAKEMTADFKTSSVLGAGTEITLSTSVK